MYRKLLVGLDGSEASWNAFHRALALARALGSAVWVLSVEEHLPRFAATVDEVEEEQEQEHASLVQVQATAGALAREAGGGVGFQIVRGRPASRLAAVAREQGVDLLVVGHRRHLSPWHRLVGSTADWLVDHAPCSVLVERPAGHRAVTSGPGEGVGLFQRILVAFDGSPGGWAALRHGIALASRATATLWALSVEELRPPGRSPEGGGSTAAAFLARLHDEARREAARHGVALSADVARGHAARAIVDHAQRMGADLVVLGHRGHAGVVEGVLGSTADRVVDAADCSVLVVREKGDGGGSP